MRLVRPTLLLDEKKCRANISRIAERARKANVKLRPHFKTHQSSVIGEWFREEGVDACTASSIQMAAYFADHGWKDITVAFPLNFLESEEINRISRIANLNLSVVSLESIKQLTGLLTNKVQCYLEIDTGYHRTGFDPSNLQVIDEVIAYIADQPLLTFGGFLSHAGQSYGARSTSEIMTVHNSSVAIMKRLGDRYRNQFPKLMVSIGDTPTCSVASDFTGVDEMRPGNLVFYDMMQVTIGSCVREDIAIAMACPVVAIERERSEVIVHGGAVHFSKDNLKLNDGSVSFGEVVRFNPDGWTIQKESSYLKSISQEHGIIKASADLLSQIRVGDLLGVLPVHACLTADVMGAYQTLDGKTIRMMPKSL